MTEITAEEVRRLGVEMAELADALVSMGMLYGVVRARLLRMAATLEELKADVSPGPVRIVVRRGPQ